MALFLRGFKKICEKFNIKTDDVDSSVSDDEIGSFSDYKAKKSNAKNQNIMSAFSNTSKTQQLASHNQASYKRIITNDPEFNEAAFCARIKKAFRLIQTAWEKRDVEKVQAFLADGTYERFLLQIDSMKKNHIIDVMENLTILRTQIVSFESNHNIDSIAVSITAKGKNYRADENTRKFIEGDKTETEFTEVWTFLRRTGAKNLTGDGLIEGQCPNCGSPIHAGRHAVCEYCNTLLRSGQHDWVLSNITQDCEWINDANAMIPGVAKYYNFDAGFNVQYIEDRASVIFWRKISADNSGNIDIIRKVAVDNFCDKTKQQYSADRLCYDNAAVGSIQVVGMDANSSKTEDFVYVKILWSGRPRKASTKPNGLTNFFGKKDENYDSIFVLKRKRGVMTDTKNGLCAAPCPTCGASETDYMSNSCQHCGHVMNDGTRDWVLNDILAVESQEFTSALSKMRMFNTKPIVFDGPIKQAPSNVANNIAHTGMAQNNGKLVEGSANLTAIEAANEEKAAAEITSLGAAAMANQVAMAQMAQMAQMNSMNQEPLPAPSLMRWAIAMMMSDGNTNERELSIVYDYGHNLGMSDDDVWNIIQIVKAQPQPMKYVAQTTDLRYDENLMRILIRVIFADGRISKNEINFLRYIGRRMNMTEMTIKAIFEEEKRRFYQRQ